MKRIVDIFSSDWSHQILGTYEIDLGGDSYTEDLDTFEREALFLAISDNLGDEDSMFAKARE
jgi:hypothetical protein